MPPHPQLCFMELFLGSCQGSPQPGRGASGDCRPSQGPFLMSSGPKPHPLLTTLSVQCPKCSLPELGALPPPPCALLGLTSSLGQPCRDRGSPSLTLTDW